MIVETIYNFFIWFYQNTILRALPPSLPGVSIDSFTSYINNFTNSISGILYIFNKILPVGLLITSLLAIMTLEIGLFIIRMFVTGWNATRGSGAKV
jgi:hypothetical protein